MATVIIVIHLMVVVAMIGLVLLQRSEGGALGIGGGSGAFMTGRGAANVLTRSTGILAAVFFATSVSLALLSRLEAGPTDIFSDLPGTASAPAPAETPATPPVSGSGSASDMLKQLGGTSSGPQTPPATDSGSANSGAADSSAADSGAADSGGPSANDLAAPMGDTMAPATGESTAPAAGDAGSTAPADGGGPQAPPASNSQ